MKERLGLKNAARFAIQPNMWGFCGEDISQEVLRSYVADRNDDSQKVRETLMHHGFPHLNSFLGAISFLTQSDVYDEAVVMSYWLGNPLTEKVGVNTKSVLIDQYRHQISPEFARRLETVLPDEMYLTHLSQVALIAAADETGTDKTNLINHDMIAYGNVVEVNMEKRTAVVMRESLRKKGDQGYEVVTTKQVVKMDLDLTPEINSGDEIVVHLGYLASKISSDQAEHLKYWTKKVAAMI